MPEQDKSSSTEPDPSILTGLPEEEIEALKEYQKGWANIGENLSLEQVALLELGSPQDEDEDLAPPSSSLPARRTLAPESLRKARRKKLNERASRASANRAKKPTLSSKAFIEQMKRSMGEG